VIKKEATFSCRLGNCGISGLDKSWRLSGNAWNPLTCG
jgi:hypothetical protein